MSTAARAGGHWRPAPFGLLGDERLAQRVSAGDERAFAIVYERYHQMLYRFCRSILHDETDAQDALQSTFAAAFAALQSGQRDAPMRPWLFRIAHNESISVLRRRRPASSLSTVSEQRTGSIEEEVAGRAAFSVLVRDLRDLTDRQRSALVLRELSGLSHQEIAIALGTSIGAAKQTIFEARRSLFEFAEGRAMACDDIRRTISNADGRVLRSRRVRAHLRECGPCAAFAAAIPSRTDDLRALVPVLPAAAAAGLFGRSAVAAVGRTGGAGLGPVAAGAAAKTAVMGAGFGANALAGVAVLATATAGVTVGVGKIVHALAQRDGTHAPAVGAGPAPVRRRPEVSVVAASLSPRSHALRDHPVRTAPRVATKQPPSTLIRITSTEIVRPSHGPRVTSTSSAPASAVPASFGVGDSGHPWRGEPARVQPTQTASAASSTSDGSVNAPSSEWGSEGGAAQPASTESAQGSQASDGSGKSRGNGSRKFDRGESGEPAYSGQANGNVNAPASVGAAAGTASSAAATVSATVEGVTSAVGSVLSTVGGVVPTTPTDSQSIAPISLPGSTTGLLHRHRDSS